MNTAERAQSVTLVREVELAINTLMSHLTYNAYVERWDKGSPAIRALNILQEAVGQEPTAGEKPQDTLDHDTKLFDAIDALRGENRNTLDVNHVIGLALGAASRMRQRAEEVLQARVYTDYWIDKANRLQEQLNEAHDIEEDLLHRLKEKNA